jgi:hypothetical protein
MQFPEANIRSPGYYIAQTTMRCLSCGRWTRVLALAVPPPHEILIEDQWQAANVSAFLFYVTALPDGVCRRLTGNSSFFRPGRAAGGSDPCWANHCEHCDAPVSDDELHCEPGGFMPEHADAAPAISLIAVWEAFQAAAAGYAADPEFFAHMRSHSPER